MSNRSSQDPLDVVDRLGHLAANAEPPPIHDSGARRLIERAMLARTKTAPERARRSLGWPLAVFTLACVALLAWMFPRDRAPAAAPAPDVSRVRLPTGDELIGSTGARYELEELQPMVRRVRLRSGSLVADVARVAPGQRFEVSTDDVRIIATGTVFSVTTAEPRTQVHVFEGRVEIEHAGRRDSLGAGESWPHRDQPHAPAAIVAAGETAAAKRATVAAASDVASPRAAPVTPAPPSVASPTATPSSISSTPTSRTLRNTARAERPRSSPSVSASAVHDEPVEAARSHVAEGRFDDALAIVDRAERRGALDGAWLLVRGDALRGLGRDRAAAEAFDAAADALHANGRLEAAFTAAYLRFHSLTDAKAALATLDHNNVDAHGSPFEERGLGLRARIYVALGRAADARATAERYLTRFPSGDLRTYMRGLTRRTAPP